MYTIAQLSEISGINETTICERIKRGWHEDKILKPVAKEETKGYCTVADLREILELEEGVRLTP